MAAPRQTCTWGEEVSAPPGNQPDGAPVLGASGVAGLWLNTGHGACGWAQACGSARALADAVAARAPAVDLQPFALTRF